MDNDRTPERGTPIYLDGCSCECLWDEVERAQAREATAEEGRRDGDDCQPQCDFDGWPVGMAYVPMQPWEKTFELDKGLRAGTIFPSLRLPFRGGGR